MNSLKQKPNGCLWIFIFGLVSLFGWIFLQAALSVPSFVAVIIAMLGAAIVTSNWLGKPSFKSILVNVVVIFALIGGLRFLGNVFLEQLQITEKEHTFNIEEGVVRTKIFENNDSIQVFESHRIWKDNYGNEYTGNLTVRENDYTALKNHLIHYKHKQGVNFWGGLYHYIDKKDTPKLDLVMKTFEAIHTEKKLNRMEFAEMVVSCIQDIPYSFVFQESCQPASTYETSIRRILEDCPECCLGNITYGIQNPVAFLQNLKGDCDTRTVMIYSILKYFNYDVAILNSTFYRHSILGINLPTPGDFKAYKGKKYVVWETTAKYYEAGKLPYTFNDISHWDVVLTSK